MQTLILDNLPPFSMIYHTPLTTYWSIQLIKQSCTLAKSINALLEQTIFTSIFLVQILSNTLHLRIKYNQYHSVARTIQLLFIVKKTHIIFHLLNEINGQLHNKKQTE